MSKKSGKNNSQRHPENPLALKNLSPGCSMWGLFHHFQHNRWNNVRKRLPRRSHASSNKHSADEESSRASNSDQAVEVQENVNALVQIPAVETKSLEPRSSSKASMKSRIKALITEEMYRKKKSSHRRSSSCLPITQTNPKATPIHHQLDSPSPDHNTSKDDPTRCHHDRMHSKSTESCELCSNMLDAKYLKQSDVDKLGIEFARDHTIVQDKSIYAIEPSKHDTIQESKLFMDALDLLNVRKEVFLKILGDPSSSLAHQWSFRRKSNLSKAGLTKSMSFPAFSSRDFKSENSVNKHGGSGKEEDEQLQECMEDKEDHSNKNLALVKVSDQFLDRNLMRKRNDNKAVVLKRFKNLGEKLKHAIRDRKKDRIIMDAVHHKIPYGTHGVSKNTPHCDYGKTPTKRFKRTSSLNESLNRYNRLLDISFNKDAKDEHVYDRLRYDDDNNNDNSDGSSVPHRRRKATLGRILSLPDMRSHASLHVDDSAASTSPNANMSGSNEQENRNDRENLLDFGEGFEDENDSKTMSELEQVSENDRCKYEEDEDGQGLEVYEEDSKLAQRHLLEEESSPIEKDHLSNSNSSMVEESQFRQFYDDPFHLQVDTKNKADFNYVKDILELAGFTRDEILGKWHSAEHPVDPLVFDEVEGCLMGQSDYSENEEGGVSCDHLLLFDLINEVILDIYERSFCYWSMPLISPARVHKMPKGYCVLEEVWSKIYQSLNWRPEIDQAIDDVVSRDLAKDDGWMNLQSDAECMGLEVEELIFDDLLDEVIGLEQF